MAQDVTFDSERYEKSQRIKRVAIPLGALLGVIVIAVVLALILRGSRGKPISGGEDTPYPYSWIAGKNGVITLEVDRAAAPGFIWTSYEEVPQLEVSAKQDVTEGKTQFTLTPKASGRYVLEFRLQREKDPDDCIYALTALSDVTYDGKTLKASLLSVSGRRLPGVVRGGEDTLCSYLLRQDEDGDLMIVIRDMEPVSEEEEEASSEAAGQEKKLEGWQCEPGDESVAEYLGTVRNDEYTIVYLRAGTNPGRTRVRIWKIETGTELTIELELDENGALLPLEHSIRQGSAAAEG